MLNSAPARKPTNIELITLNAPEQNRVPRPEPSFFEPIRCPCHPCPARLLPRRTSPYSHSFRDSWSLMQRWPRSCGCAFQEKKDTLLADLTNAQMSRSAKNILWKFCSRWIQMIRCLNCLHTYLFSFSFFFFFLPSISSANSRGSCSFPCLAVLAII